MLKKGFTLQELLITVAIVGIVAAVTVPGIMGLMPDKKKVMYMKAYNTLTNLTNEILDDPSLYYIEYRNDGTANCSGVNCTGYPIENDKFDRAFGGEWNMDGDSLKFGYCLASKMNIQEEFGTDLDNGDLSMTFTSVDGVRWTYDMDDAELSGDGGGLSNQSITIDVNPNNDNAANKCFYDEDECSDPDLFKFKIDNDGGITAVDRLGQAFLRKPTDMNSGREDKEVANGLEEVD